MKKMLDKNTFLMILKEEWRKEVRNLLEREENEKKRPDDSKKEKKKPVKLSPDLIDDNLAVGLIIKNDDGFEFKIMKVTDEYVMCVGGLSIPKTEEELGKYTLA